MPTFSTLNHSLQFGTNSPTVSIYGTDASGYIHYQTSGSFLQFEPNTKYLALKIIFDVAYSVAPFSITITPANSETLEILTAQPSVSFYVDGGDYPGATNSDIKTTYFLISGLSNSIAQLGPQTLTWHYQVNANKIPSLDTTQSISVTNAGISVVGKFLVDGYWIDPSGATSNQVLQYDGTKFHPATIAGGGGAVASVTNSDGSLTISPTTGAVIASLNLAHLNIFTVKQTFSSHIDVDGYTIDLSSGVTTNQVLQYNGTNFVAGSVALLDVAQTFTKAQNVAAFVLTDGATINTDVSQSNVFKVTLAGSRTLANPTNLVSGGTYLWIIRQDGSGNHTLAYGNLFKFPGGTLPTLTTAANAVDMLSAVYDGIQLNCVFQADFK